VTRGNEDQRFGDDDRGAVAELIRRRQQPELVGVLRRLDSPGVHHDVLGGGRKGDEDGERADRGEPVRRAGRGHPEQPDRDHRLRQQHPAAAPPQAVEDGAVEAIDDRRP
jgi:hypothetical protein